MGAAVWPFGLYLLFLITAFLGPALRVWRQTGHNAYVLPKGDDAAGYVARSFRITLVLMGFTLLLSAMSDRLPQWLASWTLVEDLRISSLGLILFVVALLWVVVAQKQMGRSWRIGIDVENTPALVATGVFALSRNPIFLGMRVAMLGALLMAPSIILALLVGAADVLIQVQVRLEEKFLAQTHGDACRQYRSRVPRWLFGSRGAT